ncbi:MAG: hypothetical protein K8T89_11735 [Planctomycetes bacterium]|nr:hypothetical protein [Planctomycetota bacterium]
MDHLIRESDFIADFGRAAGGRTFVRVVHQPTNTSRIVIGLGERSGNVVAAELVAGIVSELLGAGWVHETHPNNRST